MVGKMDATREKTYWNGEPALCRRVRVLVGKAPMPTWWCANLEGTERNAVEVSYGGRVFYLDDDEQLVRSGLGAPPPYRAGEGWWKVTVGQGGPEVGHAELPVSKVLREIAQ